jgi:uncharacterized membrane protein
MKFHPIVFVLIAYGITAAIAVCVYYIVRVIALVVRRKEDAAAPPSGPESKGGTGS